MKPNLHALEERKVIMTNILNRITDWYHRRVEADGNEPEFLPLRRDEMLDIKSNAIMRPIAASEHSSRVFGFPVFETAYSEERC
jgi:hypothetical protein